jgi:hypothetical protein
MTVRPVYFFPLIKLLVCALLLFSATARVVAQKRNIKNDVFWGTKDGQPINSQGGGIFKFPDPATGLVKYYWYGVHYKEADAYRKDPSVTQPNAEFESVTCYSSTDLVNWTFEADVLTKEEVIKPGTRSWVGRLGVAYIKELKQYAMFVQHDKEVLIAVSNSPTGQFTWHQKINMKEMIGTSNTGDQTVFTDEDNGKSYLIYSYGSGRNKIYVSEIGVKDGKVTLLDCTEVFRGESREGNCMFKYKSRYYMVASNIYGWDASYAYYLSAPDIRGPYEPVNNMLVMDGCAEDYAHITQTGFFFSIKGSKQETIVYCGDRWADFAGNGLGYNHWFPVSFDGEKPFFNSLGSWNVDAATGEWEVAMGNDYVKNGSFEADRKRIPSVVKPVQLQLTGWMTTVLQGNEISLDSNLSPDLNDVNSKADRAIVTGEHCLHITDKVNFKRKVFQIIKSTPYVKLEDAYYTLTARIKNSGGFSRLELFAESNGRKFSHGIKKENQGWTEIRIDKISVRGGKIDIGFIAEGVANAYCNVDDVSLVKVQQKKSNRK